MMRKMAKAICLALSLMMLVNLAGVEVLAADISNQQDEAGEADKGQNEETDKKSAPEADVTADPDTSTPGGEDTSLKDGDETEETDEPKQPEDALPGDNDGSKPSEPADTSDTARVNDPAEEDLKQEPQEDDSIKVQDAAEPETVGAVEGITAAPDQSGNQLKLSWTKVAEAVKYQVKVLKYQDNTQMSVYDTTAAELTVKASKGEKYYIEVTAFKTGTSDSGETEETAIAAGKIPAVLLASPSVKTTVGSTDIKLSWSAVAGADKYQVTHEKKTQDITATSYSAKSLKKNTKYDFTVQAICTFNESGKTYTYTSETAKISATTNKEKPAQVKKLTGIDGDESAILTWSKAARAESYIIYRYNATKKKWQVVKKDVKKLTYTDKKLKQGKVYKYRVAATNNGGTGQKSATVSISVKKTPEKVRSIGYKAVVKSRAPLFTKKNSKKRVKYLKPGTNVTTIDYGSGRYQIKLSDGKTYWLSKDRLSFKASIWTTRDYSTKTKEDFVNKKGYKSPTKYLIWISQYTQRVIIYQGSKGKWKVIRSGRCATGTHKNMTPKGLLYITYKEKGWFYKTRYEKPVVRFKSGNAFHSRIKSYNGGYVDATIGRPKSHGCVRLMDEDINFIYKYCPRGTTVVSY